MDKVKEFLREKIDTIKKEYRQKLLRLPEWQINSLLDQKKKYSTIDEKILFLEEKYLMKDIFYSHLLADLERIKKGKRQFTILKIDDRALESHGYTDKQKEDVYTFLNELKEII
ncbi:MAG: hypothetical protein R2814_17200 [Flavobacteriaceae bacterium]